MDDIDMNFHNLNRHQVLNKYVECLRQMRELAEQTCNVRALQFDNYILFQYFQQRRNADNLSSRGNVATDASAMSSASGTYQQQIIFLKTELLKHLIDRRRKILYWLFYLMLAFLCVSYKNEASTVVVRNIQSFIYPGMKMWRKMTLPVIKRFPGLTELYDESCLLMNPFFQVDDLNCDPCANVESVLDLSDGDAELHGTGGNGVEGSAQEKSKTNTKIPPEFVPFVFKIKQDPTELESFYNIYKSNYEIFQRDAYRVQSTNRDITNLKELFNQFNHTHARMQKLQNPANLHSSSSASGSPSRPRSQHQSHNMWRCNRMLPARLLRRLFTRPNRLPSTGVALERFVAIDTAHAPSYTLPDTECANVYVQQATGVRFIILRPTTECRHKCRTLSIRLPQSFVLSYNWWYWKPISAPDPMSESLSISLVGSYC